MTRKTLLGGVALAALAATIAAPIAAAAPAVQATNQAAALESVDATRDARRRQHQALGESRRGQPIGRP